MVLVSAVKARLAVPNRVKMIFLLSSCLKAQIMKWCAVLSVSGTPGDIARADSDALKSDKLNLLC